MIPLKEFSIHSSRPLSSLRVLEVLASQCITSGVMVAISRVVLELLAVSYLSSESSTIVQDMLIKVAEKEKDLLLSILNLGTQMSMTSSNSARIMVRKNKELEISSWLYGFLTFS
jgi:hypothetical protein